MSRAIIDINDFTILIEKAEGQETYFDTCFFDEPIIAIALYGEGDVELTVKYGEQQKQFTHTKGMVLSFYADSQVAFEHQISPLKPLECLVVATAVKNLQNLPNGEAEIFGELLDQLVHPKDHYVEGPLFLMTPEMQPIVHNMLYNPYTGKTKILFYKSQITTLLSHFFGQLALQQQEKVNDKERTKLLQAKEILIKNLDNPPSLNELAKEIGLNTFKLKKEFKELFGVPVFKYLQNERLFKAYDLIKNKDLSIQEAAWNVGYESLGSFSNAFEKKFGYRPSQLQ
ncbi:helix-turn-helix domain-containing protein [Wenyingzhuangia sp. IMCC45574]